MWAAVAARYAPTAVDVGQGVASSSVTNGVDSVPRCCVHGTPATPAAAVRGCALASWFAWHRHTDHFELVLHERLWHNCTAYTLLVEHVDDDDDDDTATAGEQDVRWQQQVTLRDGTTRWLPSADPDPRRFAHTVQHTTTWYRRGETPPTFTCATLHAPGDQYVPVDVLARADTDATRPVDVARSMWALLAQHNRSAAPGAADTFTAAPGDTLGGLAVTGADTGLDAALQAEVRAQRQAAARELSEREHAEFVRNVCLVAVAVLFACAAALAGVHSYESGRGRC